MDYCTAVEINVHGNANTAEVTIMDTDGSAPTWRRGICGHDGVSYIPFIYGTRMTRVKASYFNVKFVYLVPKTAATNTRSCR